MDGFTGTRDYSTYGLRSRIHVVTRWIYRQMYRLFPPGRYKSFALLPVFFILGVFFVLVDMRALDAYIQAPLRPLPSKSSEDIFGASNLRTRGLNNRTPTMKFRDNLRNDSSYITSWSSAGFTNQFMGYVNMIYLSTLTDRIPIIPPFAPDHHITAAAGILPFGDIFNLDVLREHLRTPILEWRDVKDLTPESIDDPYSTAEVEALGCWTTRKESAPEPIRAEHVVDHLGLDVAYTRLPISTRLNPHDREDDHVVLSRLAAVTYPRNPSVAPEQLNAMVPSPHGNILRPDQHLTCFDTMYYVTSGAEVYEWRFSWSPAWRTIGRHLPFTNRMQKLGRQYLLRMFGIETLGDYVPPFIAIHIRRGDFKNYCTEVDGHRQDCLPDPSAYKKYAEDIQGSLQVDRNVNVSNVVVMSDETSPLFWAEVENQGWFHVNHTKEDTFALYGEWYLPLIETVIQSLAVGFVGTDGSTYSLVSGRRVEDWNHGVTRIATAKDAH